MIKLENVVLASPEQLEFIIQGLRNPLNSWEKSDSGYGCDSGLCSGHCAFSPEWCGNTQRYVLGDNDHMLMQRLSKAGTDHRKFMRMMPVYVRITAPLYWWREFDTYKVGTVAISCSTMHKIQDKAFTLDNFSCDRLTNSTMKILKEDIHELNFWRDAFNCKSDKERNLYFANSDWCGTYIPTKKGCLYQMIQLLPSSYNQTSNVMMNYEVLANIYRQWKGHKPDEWREFCKWIESLPYSELITGLSIGSDQSIEEKCFSQPFPWIKEDVKKQILEEDSK